MWFNALVTNWSVSRGQKPEHQPKCQKIPRLLPNFWRHSCIRVEHMNEIADSGDIIFFSSNQLIAGMQRLVTASMYDHTAMFLRFTNG